MHKPLKDGLRSAKLGFDLVACLYLVNLIRVPFEPADGLSVSTVSIVTIPRNPRR